MTAHLKIISILLLFLQLFFVNKWAKLSKNKKYRLLGLNCLIFICISLFIAGARIEEKSLKSSWLKKRFHFQEEKSSPKKNSENRGGICICSYYTKNIASYSEKTEFINRQYAKQHGYDYIVFNENEIKSNRAPLWNKILAVQYCLNAKNKDKKKYDFVFWIDSDAYFNLFDKKLESFINPYHDFYICDDSSQSIANTGTFLLRNSNWSKEFIKLWWEMGHNSYYAHHKFHEQSVLDAVLSCDMMGINKKLAYFNSQDFNSKPIDIKKRKNLWNQTFIVHLMALSSEKRNQIIDIKLKKLARDI